MPELAPVVPLDMPELLFHQGWRKFSSTTTVAAVAAQFARVRFRNPDNSGNIIKLEGLTVTATANFEFGMSAVTPALSIVDLATVVGGAAGAGIWRDSRQIPIGSLQGLGGVMKFSKTTDAAAQVPNFFDIFNLANTTYLVPLLPLLLFPSSAIDGFIVSPANQAALVSVWWSERLIQEQEAAP